MRLDVRRAIAVAVLATACGDASSDDPTAPLPHVPRTPDAFAPIGRTPNADAATNPGADAGEPGDAGPDWAPPLALKFVDIPHDAPLLRATDLAFLPQGSPEFLWLDKDGEVHHMRLQGDRALLALKAVNPTQLGAWLAEARAGARARVVEASLTQTSPGLYDGSLTLALGAGR